MRSASLANAGDVPNSTIDNKNNAIGEINFLNIFTLLFLKILSFYIIRNITNLDNKFTFDYMFTSCD